MISQTTDRFWDCYSELPSAVKKQAKESYEIFQSNPNQPSLHFKRVHVRRAIYSVRISINYRALGIIDEDEITWFWIGTHSEYEKLLHK